MRIFICDLCEFFLYVTYVRVFLLLQFSALIFNSVCLVFWLWYAMRVSFLILSVRCSVCSVYLYSCTLLWFGEVFFYDLVKDLAWLVKDHWIKILYAHLFHNLKVWSSHGVPHLLYVSYFRMCVWSACVLIFHIICLSGLDPIFLSLSPAILSIAWFILRVRLLLEFF